MNVNDWLLLTLLASAMFLSVKAKKLTKAGAITGGLIGLFIYLGSEFTGIAMIGAFFLLGTLATSWKLSLKQDLKLAEKEKGKRNVKQVIANGGVAAALGLMAYIFTEHNKIFIIMMAASLASATADTMSSELGNIYGRRYYNILNFHKDQRGLDGVISLEGSIFGVLGSIVIALIYAVGVSWGKPVWVIVISGVLGNIMDSVLGATLQRRKLLNNDTVNLCNTIIAALISVAIYYF